MKNVLKKMTGVILSTSLLITGCTTTSIGQDKPLDSVSEISSIKSEFIKTKHIAINIEKASLYGENVKVASSFGEFTAKANDLVKSNKESLNINSLSPQLITLKDENDIGKTPLALSIIPNPEKVQNVVISAQTTAEALIFMNPAIATAESTLAEKVVAIIKALPETISLANVIESRSKDKDYLSFDNKKQTEALQKAVNATVNKLADEFQKTKEDEPANRVQGVEINAKSQQELETTLEMKNYRRRMVSLNFLSQSNQIYNQDLLAAYDLIDVAHTSLGFKPSIANFNINNKTKLDQVEVIGVGLKDFDEFKQKWDQWSTKDKLKYGTPLVKGLISDFVCPVISVITGFNINKVYPIGIIRIVTSMNILDIVKSFRNKEYGQVFKSLLGGTVNALLVNNGALLREILLKSGIELTSAILKRFTGIIGIFNLATNIVESVRTLYAYANSKIIDYFKVEYVDDKVVFKK